MFPNNVERLFNYPCDSYSNFKSWDWQWKVWEIMNITVFFCWFTQQLRKENWEKKLENRKKLRWFFFFFCGFSTIRKLSEKMIQKLFMQILNKTVKINVYFLLTRKTEISEFTDYIAFFWGGGGEEEFFHSSY